MTISDNCPDNNPDIDNGYTAGSPVRSGISGIGAIDQMAIRIPHMTASQPKFASTAFRPVFTMVLLCMVDNAEDTAERDMQNPDPDGHDHQFRNRSGHDSPCSAHEVTGEQDRVPVPGIAKPRNSLKSRPKNDARDTCIPENGQAAAGLLRLSGTSGVRVPLQGESARNRHPRESARRTAETRWRPSVSDRSRYTSAGLYTSMSTCVGFAKSGLLYSTGTESCSRSVGSTVTKIFPPVTLTRDSLTRRPCP